MKITKTIVIDKSADDVWKTVAEDFGQAHLWMSSIHHSHAIDEGLSNVGAPMKGRICELSDKPNGMYADETITCYSKEDKSFTFEVTLMNAPAVFPVRKNVIKISVKERGDNQSEVIWTAVPELKTFGIILSPLLKLGLGKMFGGVLKDLKAFSENSNSTISQAV